MGGDADGKLARGTLFASIVRVKVAMPAFFSPGRAPAPPPPPPPPSSTGPGPADTAHVTLPAVPCR